MDPQPQRAWREACGTVLAESFSRGLIRGFQSVGREALVNYALTPFKVTDTTDHFDVIATLNGGGISGQAGALRHGISRALLSAGDYRAELKKAGYLTRDSRMAVSYTHLTLPTTPYV